MIKGDLVPDLMLKDQNRNDFCFRELVGEKAFVVYFYPKDFTPGCTKEACSFRDSYQEFQDLGAEVIGISADTTASHAKFSEKYNLPYNVRRCPFGKARLSKPFVGSEIAFEILGYQFEFRG